MILRKIISIAGAAVISLSAALQGIGGFNGEEQFALPAKTPYDKKNVEIRWNTKEGENVGAPIASGDFVFLPTRNLLQKISVEKGDILAFAEFDEKVCRDFSGAVSGDVIVQPTANMLYAVDCNSMEVISSGRVGEICSNVGVAGDFAYNAVKIDGEYKFLCTDIKNDFKTVWEYSSESEMTDPALFKNFAVFGAGGKLAVCSLDTGEFAENEIDENGNVVITNVFAGKYAIFMTCSDGTLKKMRLDENGNAEEDSLETLEIGEELSALAEFNNRVYVGSKDRFFIVDGLNMEILKSFPELKNACSPVICYGNGQRAYTVAPHRDEGRDIWYLYGVLDTEEEQSLSEIAKIIDFSNGKIAVSQNGEMFFRDGKGQLWCVAVTKNNIFVSIVKVILTIAIIVLAVVTISALAKRRTKKPKF